ncbi:spermatogenesis-associated protein 31D3-like [Manis javanica]|uniref:spermatogenesis-associated protein 31D3-like n=1 Tax=Manis javanica TaxID=9974 RepID=UPI003C6D8805
MTVLLGMIPESDGEANHVDMTSDYNGSHRGQNYNITCFRQPLCPDPFCQVCNTTTVEVNRLLCPEVLEDSRARMECVLQKQQECSWGLPTVVQRSQVKFCPLAPSFPICKASQPHASVSILPGEFPLSDEIWKKLEQHLRKRLIKHRYGLPYRVLESLSRMMPPSDSLEISGSKRDHDPEGSSYEDLVYDSEEELQSHMVRLSRGLGEYEGWRELVNILRVHLSKKSEEISQGQLPGAVQNSWESNLVSGANSKPERLQIKPHRGCSTPDGDRVGTVSSAPVLQYPLPATSLVAKEG